ncbi:hypothetical protein L211DRAFT_241185 [Terfezia boudieri ATCC MYA-4762]|uniref:Uncharacterized protein n=1 Tax=Terfezia boudieri ATCC MYA-4762 TaxID=1051890 RepID=A0A3N4M4M9_9PEZI|nr:hypothetical protein L211DRAFT_241185 [Terfezia boudieri ATCC MYA-4762]
MLITKSLSSPFIIITRCCASYSYQKENPELEARTISNMCNYTTLPYINNRLLIFPQRYIRNNPILGNTIHP